MKLITKTSASLLAMLVLAPTLATAVSAEQVADYNTTGSIAFEAGEDVVTPPVDPEDPSNPDPELPVDPEEPGTPGPLSIDFASSWKFGKQEIASSDKTYYAHPQVMTDGSIRQLYAQVTDTRGTFAGWSLSLTQAAQFEDEDENILEGAQLSFAGTGSTSSTSTTPASNITSNFSLTPGAEQLLVSAQVNEGTGTNVYSFGTPADYDADAKTDEAVATQGPVQLSVVGGSMHASAYTTNLVWTLSDTPV